jgi:hypothetical protein
MRPVVEKLMLDLSLEPDARLFRRFAGIEQSSGKG